MTDAHPTPGSYVLRALNAAEIAESCYEPQLRASFFDLSRTWLAMAAEEPRASDDGGAPCGS